MSPISSNPLNFIQIGSEVPPAAGLTEDSTFLQMTPDEFSNCLLSVELPSQPIKVLGDLDLSSCTSLISLPAGLHIEGYLNLAECTSLVSLPEGLSVGGDLRLSGCTSLISLPEGLHVGGGLNLIDCMFLTALPKGLSVGRDLELQGCISLTKLPERLSVIGDLNLSDCTSLTLLSSELKVGGDLYLWGCISLRALPTGLYVGGILNLNECRLLIALPEGLHVGGSLFLGNCVSLTALPEGLSLFGNLDLSGCRSVSALPNDITRWGPRADGNMRELLLVGAGFSDALIERLWAAEVPGMRFIFNLQAEPVVDQFATLVEAVNFWRSLLVEEEAVISLNLRSDQQADLLQFLARLKATAEYQNLPARLTLAKRIYDVLKEIEDCAFKETACLILNEGLSTCHDRIMSTLDKLDLMMQTRKADERGEREELRKLGRGMLMLEEVQKAARAHASTLTWVDEIEIQLAFQIGLRDRLQLPLSTGNMIFRGCANVSDEKIQQVGTEIEGRISDAVIDDYLLTWSPWQKLLRREAFYTLDPEGIDAPRSLDWICCISTEELTEGYLYGGRLYAPENLRKIFIENGVDPFTRDQINLENVTKVVKR